LADAVREHGLDPLPKYIHVLLRSRGVRWPD
jgi:hypothetical protein